MRWGSIVIWRERECRQADATNRSGPPATTTRTSPINKQKPALAIRFNPDAPDVEHRETGDQDSPAGPRHQPLPLRVSSTNRPLFSAPQHHLVIA